MDSVLKFVAEAKKFLVVITGMVAMAISAGLLTGNTRIYVTVILGAVTSVLTYLVPNAIPVAAVTKPVVPPAL